MKYQTLFSEKKMKKRKIHFIIIHCILIQLSLNNPKFSMIQSDFRDHIEANVLILTLKYSVLNSSNKIFWSLGLRFIKVLL